MTTLSLVTGTRNRPDSLKRLMDSIQLYTDVSWELIIADASDEPVTNFGLSNVRILPERPPLGYTRAYNRAFKATVGKWVLFLNDDAEVMPHYATEAIKFMESHPQIGLGALYYSNKGGRYMVNELEGMVYANFGIIERSLLESIGWLDEDLRMYGSDNALAFRVLMYGRGVTGIPNAQIVHHEINDIYRQQNQFDRFPEADKLKAKYLPYKSYMWRTYRKALQQP